VPSGLIQNKGDIGLPEIFPIKEIREHENSVDALCANPTNEKEFSTASHDQTIKIWDAPSYKCRATMKGHEKGVWSLMYDQTGKRLVSSSPDSFVKIWDAKSGKCTDTLKGHSSFCYKAAFDHSGIHVVSCGTDKLLNYWDLRKTQAPIFSNNES
jgi:WD40 repeat protein